MTFSDKVKRTRELLGLTQQELADLVGVTKRAVAGWETEGALPRPATLRKLADTLQVSIEYLRIDSIENPLYGIEKKNYVDEARDRYGEVAAKEMEFLLLFQSMGKPDTHLIDICERLNLSDRDPVSVFEAIVTMSVYCRTVDPTATPNKIDKILWLISSGRFYLDNITIGRHKDDFLLLASKCLG